MMEIKKKYEAVLEAAFQLVEFSESTRKKGKQRLIKQARLQNDLLEAVAALSEFRKVKEPVFILRGRDKAAAKTIYAWGIFAEREGAQPEMTCYASRKSREIETWQEAHPKMIKIPN